MVLLGLFLAAAPSLVMGQPAHSEAAASLSAAEPLTEILQAYDRWATQQELYPPQLIAGFRGGLQNRFKSLPPDDAARLRDEIVAKLNVLGDPKWRDIELWFSESLAVASDSYANKLLAMLPDLVSDSPGETRSKLRAITVRAINLKQAQQGFEQNRQAAVQIARADAHQLAELNAQYRSRMTFSSPNLYSPAAPNSRDANQRYSGYVSGRLANPFSYAWGIGFF